MKGICSFSWGYGKKQTKPETASLDLRFTIDGKELGLKNPGATGPINVRFGGIAYAAK